jgi:hypothetical protein
VLMRARLSDNEAVGDVGAARSPPMEPEPVRLAARASMVPNCAAGERLLSNPLVSRDRRSITAAEAAAETSDVEPRVTPPASSNGSLPRDACDPLDPPLLPMRLRRTPAPVTAEGPRANGDPKRPLTDGDRPTEPMRGLMRLLARPRPGACLGAGTSGTCTSICRALPPAVPFLVPLLPSTVAFPAAARSASCKRSSAFLSGLSR